MSIDAGIRYVPPPGSVSDAGVAALLNDINSASSLAVQANILADINNAGSAVTASLTKRYAALNDFYFDPLDPQFGGVRNPATDNTAAVQAAVAAAKAVNGWVVLRTQFLVNTSIVQDDAFGIMGVNGLGGLTAGPLMPAHAPTLWTKVTGATVALTQGHVYGWVVKDLRLQGNGRTVNAKGWQLDFATGGTVHNVQIRDYLEEGFLCNTSVRETVFDQVQLRGCGALGNGFAAAALAQSTNADAHNNLTFTGFMSIYPFGIGLNVECTDDTTATRNIRFDAPMFHGFTPGTPVTDEGVLLTPDWQCVGAPMVQIADAAPVVFTSPRAHRSGYGQPLFLIRQNPNSVTTRNTVTIIDPFCGLPEHQSGVVVATPATDIFTLAGIQLGTGALVRFTTTVTLPAPLALLTDYYAIRVTDDTFKVATTRANAEAGTAIDLTDAGTGVHTVTTQDFLGVIEGVATNDVTIIGGCATDDVSNVRAAFVNKSANGVVRIWGFAAQGAPAVMFEPFSSLDSPTQLIGRPPVVIKQANEQRISNAIVIDNELVINLTPGYWIVRGWILSDGAAGSDLNIQWFSSALGVNWIGQIQFEGQSTAAASNVGAQFNQVLARGGTGGRGTLAAGTPLGFGFHGFIKADVAAQFQIRWAQNTTDPANPTTIYAGSWLEAIANAA